MINKEIVKTFLKYINNQKNNIMYRLSLLCSLLVALNASAISNDDSNYLNSESEQEQLEKLLFNNIENSSSTDIDISAIEIIELEEEVALGFDPIRYLPENFNALKGKHDLDLESIEVIEIEEEVELGFDTTRYLPENCNPYSGM